LFNFPRDQQTSGEQPFWSGPKRCPDPIAFDVNEELHLDYVVSGANLKAEIFGIEKVRDRAVISGMVQQVDVSFSFFFWNRDLTMIFPSQVPRFEPRSGIKIAENDAALQQQQSDNGSYNTDRVNNIVDELKALGKPPIIPTLTGEEDTSNFEDVDKSIKRSPVMKNPRSSRSTSTSSQIVDENFRSATRDETLRSTTCKQP
jgi:ubiquitin-activating enzyme E1